MTVKNIQNIQKIRKILRALKIRYSSQSPKDDKIFVNFSANFQSVKNEGKL
jgi:hypothetical protein